MSRLSRRITCLAAGVAVALVSVTATASAEASLGAGLWSSTHQAEITDCGAFSRDANNFCYLDDGGSVELGVKFTSSKTASVSASRHTAPTAVR